MARTHGDLGLQPGGPGELALALGELARFRALMMGSSRPRSGVLLQREASFKAGPAPEQVTTVSASCLEHLLSSSFGVTRRKGLDDGLLGEATADHKGTPVPRLSSTPPL